MKMKGLILAAAVSVVSLAAFARHDDRDFRRPGRSCQVIFDKCDIAVGGVCLKWNNKSIRVSQREARWGCRIARQEYGRIRNCYVRCN